MKRENSLKGKKCFNEVYQKGKSFKSKNFKLTALGNCLIYGQGLCIKKDSSNPVFKAAVVVNKRFGKAHERNKAKRRVRAIVSRYSGNFNGSFCMSINIYGKINDMDFSQLEKELEDLFIKAGVLLK